MATARLDSIDFWRGIVLATIFVNHIPGNILGAFTPRNFGFSDASEAFVFISGLSVAIAYGKRFRAKGAAATKPLIRRAIRLYFVHLALTIAAVMLFGVATLLTGQDQLLADHGVAHVFADPLAAALRIATLSEQISYFNILPLYVALLAFAPVLFLIGMRDRALMIGISALVYGVGRFWAPDLLGSPDNQAWYFNPFAWQFMFTAGMFVGLRGPEGELGFRPGLYRLALGVTLIGAVIVTNAIGFAPGLVDAAGQFLDWNKSNLGSVRILAFFALAYCVYGSQATARLRSLAIYPVFSLLGRQGLPVFCLGSLMSAVGQILNETWLSSPAVDVCYVALGLGSLVFCARMIERRGMMIATAQAVLSPPDSSIAGRKAVEGLV